MRQQVKNIAFAWVRAHLPSSLSAALWESGKTVGGYSLLAEIAKGGMGEIWLARQSGPHGFERVIVIKRIIPQEDAAQNLELMLLDEARIAAQLNHPNIVQVYELGECDGSAFIAMEYVHGENLASVVRRGVKLKNPLPMACGVRIVAQAAEALAHAHAKKGLDGKPLGLVHRDVSPQNVIVTYDGNVKLVDFGIAKAKAMARESTTADGTVKGKFVYMSPEHARGELVDGRSDLFSLGVVLFEVLSQSRFYDTQDELAALQLLLQGGELPRLDVRSPWLPAALVKIVHRCIEFSPSARYATARELAADLEAWLKTTTEGSAAQLEEWLQRAFVDRIAQRELLIASAGDSGPVLANDVLVKSDRSMPGHTGATTQPLRRRPRKGPAIVAAVALAVALTGVVLAKAQETSGPEPVAQDVAAEEVVAVALPTVKVVAPVELESGPARATAPTVVAAVTPTRRAVEKPKGTLSLDTTPWSQVYLGRTMLGDTPLVGVSVPAGVHKVRLRNPDKGIERTVEIEVQPGKNTGMRLKL
jgi:serine/threonine-protein kinase